MGREPPGFGLDQLVAPRRRLDPADLAQMIRPGLARDPQEIQRMLPILIELIGDQFVERVPVDAARDHVVHQPRQVAGELQRRCRAADHQRRRDRAFRPGRNQPRQRQPALELAESWRNFERRCAAILFRLFREAEFVLVDIAERDDARQYRGIRAQYVEKDFARQPPGAPGRQIERRVRKPGRILARLESIDQPALDQSGDDGAQERYGDGNAENTHGQPDSGSGGNIGGDFPSVMADAVVTCRPAKAGDPYCRGVRD